MREEERIASGGQDDWKHPTHRQNSGRMQLREWMCCAGLLHACRHACRQAGPRVRLPSRSIVGWVMKRPGWRSRHMMGREGGREG